MIFFIFIFIPVNSAKHVACNETVTSKKMLFITYIILPTFLDIFPLKPGTTF